MKNSIAILLVLAAASIFGCNSITSTIPGTTSGSVTANVNSKSWTTIGVPGLQSARATRNSSSGIVTVTGFAADGTEITLVLGTPHVGTFNLGVTMSGVTETLAEYSQGIPDTSTAYVSIPTPFNLSPGAITVSSFDTVNAQLSGSFNFIARKTKNFSDSVVVTSGTFTNVPWSK
jgi:hypothetical protein